MERNFMENLLDGVEVGWKPLGEVAELKRGKTITAKTKTAGDIPVISGGQKPAYYNSEYNRDGETITVAGSGAYAGYIMFWNKPIFVSDAFSVKPDLSVMNTKYVFHFLLKSQSWIHNLKKGSGVPHVYPKDLAVLEVPIPCPDSPEKSLEIQAEIVRILDTFTEITTELTAELTARKKQYNYYREQLLTFEEGEVEWKRLGEIGEFVRGNGLQKKNLVESGVGCIHYGQIYTYYGNFAYQTKSFVSPALANKLRKAKKGDLIIATTSENIEDVCKPLVWLGEDEVCVSGETYIFKHNQNPKYLAYYLQTPMFFDYKKKNRTGTKVIRVHGDKLKKFEIPLPSISEQNRIVSILDKFDAMTSSISEGLPREIELRQKQYEYYRNMLLSFPKEVV